MRLQATLESRGKLVRQLRANAEKPFSRGRKRGEVMFLFEIVTDSYGESFVRVYVWAESQKRAETIFRETFPQCALKHIQQLLSSGDAEFITKLDDSGFGERVYGGEAMDNTQKAIAEFASRSKVVIEIYGDKFGKSIRARYQDDNGVEHGCAILLGIKRQSDGLPHTIGSAVEEAIQGLLEAAT